MAAPDNKWIFADLNIEDEALALELLAADAAALSSQSDVEEDGGILSDSEMAARIFHEEIYRSRLALDDHQFAEALEYSERVDLEASLYTADADSELSESEEDEPEPDIPCVNCTDDCFDEDLATAPCGHRYCRDCIQETFTRSFKDEGLFPPRCCRQAIPLDAVGTFLTVDIEATFALKAVEYGTKYRVYCSAARCETFLTPEMNIGEAAAQCSDCQAITCTLCKGPTHEGDCPVDEEMRQLDELAAGEGWTRCPECRRMVDLIQGCYHMSCPCKTQFCYVCAAFPWKACECPQWDEELLMERAREVVEVQNQGHIHDGPPALGAIMAVAEDIAGRHNCDHSRFLSQLGRHQCSMCNKTMPDFIYRCRNCHILVCRSCRRNRLE